MANHNDHAGKSLGSSKFTFNYLMFTSSKIHLFYAVLHTWALFAQTNGFKGVGYQFTE